MFIVAVKGEATTGYPKNHVHRICNFENRIFMGSTYISQIFNKALSSSMLSINAASIAEYKTFTSILTW